MRHATTAVTPSFEIMVEEVDGRLELKVRQVFKTKDQRRYGGYTVVQDDLSLNRFRIERMPIFSHLTETFRIFAVESKNTPNSDQNLGTIVFRVLVRDKPLDRMQQKGMAGLVDLNSLRAATNDEIVAYLEKRGWDIEEVL